MIIFLFLLYFLLIGVYAYNKKQQKLEEIKTLNWSDMGGQ